MKSTDEIIAALRAQKIARDQAAEAAKFEEQQRLNAAEHARHKADLGWQHAHRFLFDEIKLTNDRLEDAVVKLLFAQNEAVSRDAAQLENYVIGFDRTSQGVDLRVAALIRPWIEGHLEAIILDGSGSSVEMLRFDDMATFDAAKAQTIVNRLLNRAFADRVYG